MTLNDRHIKKSVEWYEATLFTLKPLNDPQDKDLWVALKYDRHSMRYECIRPFYDPIGHTKLLKPDTVVYPQ